MQQNNKILLTFDIEEFDCPLEYNQKIDIDEQLRIGHRGLMEISEILDLRDSRATLFTTAFFAENFQEDIKRISTNHEIASHTYFHSVFREDDLYLSRKKLESIIGKPVTGLRMPKMKFIDANTISKAGYFYDSSINPTWVPGRYNNLLSFRTLFNENGLMRLPVSVTPHFRIPLFWLAFKNMPYSIFLKLVLQTLRHDGSVCLYFHPWEFTDLSGYKVPFYIKRGSNKVLLRKLVRLVRDLSEEGEFVGMNEFLFYD
jgi:peptidoglycan/xylan/chitin deacetylase (PgdA/CDA1 family)